MRGERSLVRPARTRDELVLLSVHADRFRNLTFPELAVFVGGDVEGVVYLSERVAEEALGRVLFGALLVAVMIEELVEVLGGDVLGKEQRGRGRGGKGERERERERERVIVLVFKPGKFRPSRMCGPSSGDRKNGGEERERGRRSVGNTEHNKGRKRTRCMSENGNQNILRRPKPPLWRAN